MLLSEQRERLFNRSEATTIIAPQANFFNIIKCNGKIYGEII